MPTRALASIVALLDHFEITSHSEKGVEKTINAAGITGIAKKTETDGA